MKLPSIKNTVLYGLPLIVVAITLFCFRGCSPNDISIIIEEKRLDTPMLFIVVFLLRSFVFFPGIVLTFVASQLFSPLTAIICCTVGGTISACVVFFMSRFYAKWFIWGDSFKLDKDLTDKLNSRLKRRGFITVFLLRIFPVLPFDITNYVCGVSQISFWKYFWGTFFGVIPWTVIYVLLGKSLDDPRYLIPSVILCVAAYFFLRRYKGYFS